MQWQVIIKHEYVVLHQCSYLENIQPLEWTNVVLRVWNLSCIHSVWILIQWCALIQRWDQEWVADFSKWDQWSVALFMVMINNDFGMLWSSGVNESEFGKISNKPMMSKWIGTAFAYRVKVLSHCIYICIVIDYYYCYGKWRMWFMNWWCVGDWWIYGFVM